MKNMTYAYIPIGLPLIGTGAENAARVLMSPNDESSGDRPGGGVDRSRERWDIATR